jgi:hypothetical protein
MGKYRMRQMQDSNLREQNPSDFKSDALTTRPICLRVGATPHTYSTCAGFKFSFA